MLPQTALLGLGAIIVPQPTTAPSFIAGGGAGSGNNINIDLQVGDFIVMNAVATKTAAAAPTVTSPSGVGTWTRLGGASILNGDGLTHEVWYTRATSAGVQTVNVNYSSTPSAQYCAVEIWRGVNTTDPFASSLFIRSGATANWNGQTINVAFANSYLSVALATLAQGNGPNSLTGWTEWGQIQSGSPQACQEHWYRTANAGDYAFNWPTESNVVFCAYALKGTGGGT